MKHRSLALMARSNHSQDVRKMIAVAFQFVCCTAACTLLLLVLRSMFFESCYHKRSFLVHMTAGLGQVLCLFEPVGVNCSLFLCFSLRVNERE